ncbi:MAG: hypothetical protein JSU86_04820 [Phycisphaerales bacterium]|nr:MAG: hypothetical protein JSU86_04820 [Phycisphaerales bacterium]
MTHLPRRINATYQAEVDGTLVQFWGRDGCDYRVYTWRERRSVDRTIGSGVTESAVKLFNKRVKGNEQFWSMPGVEGILSVRALRLSQDDRWPRYWNTRQAYQKAA